MITGTRRGKQVRLVGKPGIEAQRDGARRLQAVIDAWRDRHGSAAVDALGAALAPIVGDGTRAGSALFGGLDPPAGTWRADVPAPVRLPWFPMVLHRGGFPDGS